MKKYDEKKTSAIMTDLRALSKRYGAVTFRHGLRRFDAMMRVKRSLEKKKLELEAELQTVRRRLR